MDSDAAHADRGRLLSLLPAQVKGSAPNETAAPRRELSATERLHNICDALSEHADESPFTREEWDRVDNDTVRMQEHLRISTHALGAIAAGDAYPQKLASEALGLIRSAVEASAPSECEMHERRAAEKGWPLPEKTSASHCIVCDDTPPSDVPCTGCGRQS